MVVIMACSTAPQQLKQFGVGHNYEPWRSSRQLEHDVVPALVCAHRVRSSMLAEELSEPRVVLERVRLELRTAQAQHTA